MMNKGPENNLNHTRILLSLSALKFRRVSSNMAIHASVRDLSAESRTLKFKVVRSSIVNKGQHYLKFMLLKALSN
jgi:hypothetical protein